MSNTGKLRLELLNAYGEPLGEKVDIILRHQQLTDNRIAKGVTASSKKIVIENLHGNPQGLYLLEIDPPSYLPVRHFVNIKPSGFTDKQLIFPVDQKKVVDVKFPKFSDLPDDAQRMLNNSDRVFSFVRVGGSICKGHRSPSCWLRRGNYHV